MTTQPPLLLLSSGARPRYLEDVVRALALPGGGIIQFRYEQRLLANNVKDHFRSKGLKGHTCYLAYLDTKTPGTTPEIVPVREATILDVNERGSSFIFRMEVGRYVRTNELVNVLAFIRGNSQDKLPEWKSNFQNLAPNESPLDGFWVNFLTSGLSDVQLGQHDPEHATHLSLFEKAVDNLCTHTADFGDASRRLFYNVVGIKSAAGACQPVMNGGWKLAPDGEYSLGIYHYYPDEGPNSPRAAYWLGSKVTGSSISLLGADILRADSEYDFKTLIIQTGSALRKVLNSLSLYRTTDPADSNAITADIVFNVDVEADTRRNIAQAVLIGTLVAVPALIAIYPDIPSWKALIVLCGGLAAGFASVFKFAKGV